MQLPHADPRPRAPGRAARSPTAPREIGAELGPTDVLKFKDQKKYADRIKAAQKATGERDALVAMQGTLKGARPGRRAFDFAFMGGSMGSVVGERFARAAERARRASAARSCASPPPAARACRKACSR